jgi:hypothetical protein
MASLTRREPTDSIGRLIERLMTALTECLSFEELIAISGPWDETSRDYRDQINRWEDEGGAASGNIRNAQARSAALAYRERLEELGRGEGE